MFERNYFTLWFGVWGSWLLCGWVGEARMGWTHQRVWIAMVLK